MDRLASVLTDTQAASRIAAQIRRQWHEGQSADVAEALARYPQLRQCKSVLLDLACDEYQQRLRRGEAIGVEEFAHRFPAMQKSLQLLLLVRGLLGLSSDDLPDSQSVRWPEPGDEFLGFTLLDEIGRGAFARVFLGRERAVGERLVALKVAVHGGGEAEILGRLQHPHIVPVYSVQEDPDTSLTAVCMPYLGRTTVCDILDHAFAGSDLPTRASVLLDVIHRIDDPSELSDAAPPSVLRSGSYVDAVVFLAERIADALAYTHTRGICHCDLKPSNVLISVDGRPLVLDFNLSLERGRDTSRLGGTIPYMAPEGLRFLACDSDECPGPADPRSDLFSFGVILYELLSGQLPFGPIPYADSLRETADGLIKRQAKGATPIRGRNGDVGRRLAETIEACLALNPEHRPQSAAEIASALGNERRPVARARRWAYRRRRPVAAVMLGTFLAGASCVAYLCARPPYEIRQLQQGLQFLDQAEYRKAIGCFDSALRANPDSSEALFARGRAYLKSNNPQAAFEDFRAVLAREPNAAAAAAAGYCLNRLRYHEGAMQYYSLAARLGWDSVGMLNNMGYSCLQLDRLDQAAKYLRAACERGPTSQEAHHNLAVAHLRKALAGEALATDARFHIEKAIHLGPASADLFHTAAVLTMLGEGNDPSAVDRALGYLDRARLLGLTDEVLTATAQFRALHGRAEFKRLLERAPTIEPAQPVLIVDPL